MQTSTALMPNSLDTLADIINTAQKNIEFHAKSMLLEAKDAGNALLQAKKDCKHGEFKQWVEKNTTVSYRMAAKYMKVAKLWSTKSAADFTFETSIDTFIGNEKKPKASTSTFTKGIHKSASPDLNRALRLAALAHRGAEGEKDVAKEKLFSLYPRKALVGLVVEACKLWFFRSSKEDLIEMLAEIAEEKL